jgi:general L-amino acid transport system permease protein
VGAVAWVRANLLSSWGNTALTLIAVWLIYEVATGVLGWAFLRATWTGADGAACTYEGAGACWPFVTAKFGQFMYGRYPDAERWRVDLTYVLAIAGLAPLMIPRVPYKQWSSLYLIAVFPILALLLLSGGLLGLPFVETSLWGGLMVTLIVASAGIAGAFPIGILLALGRRSAMPVVRMVSIGFIEFVRGVPLITVLFMASVMLPLFLPEGVSIDKLLRAQIAMIMFAAAYLAEVVRGGLQAIPKGQYEGAMALGLSYPLMTTFVILPQALKISIPGLVNSFIGQFMDSTLVVIIGLFELLGIVQVAARDPNWNGLSTEGFVFAGVFFFVICFSMSRYSVRLERKLHTGHKR